MSKFECAHCGETDSNSTRIENMDEVNYCRTCTVRAEQYAIAEVGHEAYLHLGHPMGDRSEGRQITIRLTQYKPTNTSIELVLTANEFADLMGNCSIPVGHAYTRSPEIEEKITEYLESPLGCFS